MDHFDVLKWKRYFKSWHSNLVSIASTEDVENIIDPTYIPLQADIPLFQENQNHMYEVAVKILKTDIEVEYVSAHDHDKDA